MKPKQHLDSVICDGSEIPYSYYRSRRRRTLGMTVRADRSVTVRVPAGTPLDTIREFVRQRATWIAKVRRRLEETSPATPVRYADGTVLRYLGRNLRLKVEKGFTDRVSLREGMIVVSTPGEHSDDCLRPIIDAWYRRQAARVFGVRAVVCHQRMRSEGFPLPPVAIRDTKTRWGSYSYRTGRISLSLNLIRTAIECIDYVIIHELCHVRVRHHGPDFWRFVERYVPDHPELRKRLHSG